MTQLLHLLLLWLAFSNAMPVDDVEKLHEMNLTMAVTYPTHLDDNAPSNRADKIILINGENKLTIIPINGRNLRGPKTEKPTFSANFDSGDELMSCELSCEVIVIICTILEWVYVISYAFSFVSPFYRDRINCRVVAVIDFVVFKALAWLLYMIFISAILLLPMLDDYYINRSSNNKIDGDFTEFMFLVQAPFFLLATIIKRLVYVKCRQMDVAYIVLSVLNGLIGYYCYLIFIVNRGLPWLQLLFWLSYLEFCMVLTRSISQVHLFQKIHGSKLIRDAPFDYIGECINLMGMAILSSLYAKKFVFTEKPAKLCLGMISVGLPVIALYQYLIWGARKLVPHGFFYATSNENKNEISSEKGINKNKCKDNKGGQASLKTERSGKLEKNQDLLNHVVDDKKDSKTSLVYLNTPLH